MMTMSFVLLACVLLVGCAHATAGGETGTLFLDPTWRPGAAANLYARKEHPRIVIGPEQLRSLRSEVQAGDAHLIHQGLRATVRRLVRKMHDAPDLTQFIGDWDHANRKPGSEVVLSLHDIAMVAALDDDPDAVEALRRVFAISPKAMTHSPPGNRSYAMGKAATQLALAFDLMYAKLTAEERRAFCDWAYTHSIVAGMEYLEKCNFLRFPGSNLNINVVITVLAMQMAIDGEPGVPDLTAIRQRSLTMLEAAVNASIGPDGYPEEDLCYGTSTVAKCAQVLEPLRRAGWFDVYRACPRYARFGRAVTHFIEPWGHSVSLTGDNADDVPLRELVLARQAQETGDLAPLWLAGALGTYTEPSRRVTLRPGFVVTADAFALLMHRAYAHARTPGELSLPTAFRERGRGIVALRDAWTPDATFAVLDGSQRSAAAPGHAHASGGHFSLSALGESFAISPGRYNMEQNCHNVTLIDGKSGEDLDGEWRAVQHAALLTHFVPGPFVDHAGVDSSQQHNAKWARRWLWLVKGAGAPAYAIVVDDINPGDRWAEYWWQLHTLPGNKIELNGQHATVHGARNGNLLDVHFSLPNPNLFPAGKGHTLALEQDIAAHSAQRYLANPREQAAGAASPTAARQYQRPRLLAKIAGPTGHILALMLPRAAGQAPARVETLPTLPGALAVRVTFAEVEDTIIFAFDHGLLEATDIKARGRWCVVRRSRSTGAVLEHAVGEGVSLVVGSTTIVIPAANE